jgi:peptidoglycan/xylan/chitin deacetylase (PgdA/CDA1 family)/glycosyltransferase involved in cell wall biosynthesis
MSPGQINNSMISIVIPARNEEKLLGACLESLKNQAFDGSFEIIVADNASTDKTAEVAKRYGVKVVYEPKPGVVYARQAGTAVASGEIIIQADADTVYPPDWLRRIDKFFSTHPRHVALAGTYEYRQGAWWALFEYIFRNMVNFFAVIFYGVGLYISGANFAFRRRAWLELGGYDPAWFYPDQWGIANHLRKLGKVRYDSGLIVYTSDRRIAKPFLVLGSEIFRNARRTFGYFFRFLRNASKSRTKLLLKRQTPLSIGLSILLIASLSIVVFGYASPTAQVFGHVYYQAKTNQKIVALSFDDGPNEPYTSEILNILDSYGIKATFFVTGDNVLAYPQVAQRIVAEGHVLGNHTAVHNANHALSRQGEKDIASAQQIILSVTGVVPHLYRPPHGKKSPWELDYLKDNGLIEVNWSVAANEAHAFLDFGHPTASGIAHSIVSKVKPGKIILLHDGYGLEHGDNRADKALTGQALTIIIHDLLAQGYSFVTIPTLLNVSAYN